MNEGYSFNDKKIDLTAEFDAKTNNVKVDFVGPKYNDSYKTEFEWFRELEESEDSSFSFYIDFTIYVTIGGFKTQCDIEFKSNVFSFGNGNDFEIHEKNGDYQKLSFLIDVFGENFKDILLKVVDESEVFDEVMEKMSDSSTDDNDIYNILFDDYVFKISTEELKKQIEARS